MKAVTFVTGAAGFIGSNVIDRLLAEGGTVIGYDNFSTGRIEFLENAMIHSRFRLVQGDILNETHLTEAMRGCDRVIHLAANADVRHGLENPSRDLEQNTLGTQRVLEAMRCNRIRDIMFSSSGSVYGNSTVFPTPEDAPMPLQTSLYGASKLAAEGLLAAYVEGFGFRARILRFVSILGPRYTHGHVIDFCAKLRRDPTVLNVLGDGTACKSYLAVEDCIEAIVTVLADFATKEDRGSTEVYNLGTDDSCRVSDSIGWICSALGLNPQVYYGNCDRGWIGDNPFILLKTDKIRSMGWKPRVTIREAVENTVAWLQANQWIFFDR